MKKYFAQILSFEDSFTYRCGVSGIVSTTFEKLWARVVIIHTKSKKWCWEKCSGQGLSLNFQCYVLNDEKSSYLQYYTLIKHTNVLQFSNSLYTFLYKKCKSYDRSVCGVASSYWNHIFCSSNLLICGKHHSSIWFPRHSNSTMLNGVACHSSNSFSWMITWIP